MTAQQPRKSLGVGFIGAGSILRRQAMAFRSSPEQPRLVAVADIDGARAEAGRSLFGMQKAYQDHRELLAREDIDVVAICTRPNLHAPLVEDALRAGKHVLCEKPIAHTLADADRIIAACEAHPEGHVSCVYQWRADPTVELFHELVEGDELGRLVMANVRLRAWRPDDYYQDDAPRESWSADGGGVLIVIGIHQLDILVSLLGDPVELSARMEAGVKPSEGDDLLVGWVRFASGALASICSSVCDQENRFSVELVGERAAVQLHGGGDINCCQWEVSSMDRALDRKLRQMARQRVPRHRLDPGPLAVRVLERVARQRGRPWQPPPHWWHGPFVRRYLETLAAGEPAPVSPREARRSLELAVALYQSAFENGSVVRLPLKADAPLYAGVEAGHLRAAGGDR